MSFKFQNIFKKKIARASSQGKNSFSQCGEDMIIDYVFSLRGVNKPSYVDIGANDPYYLSNTAYFYNKGCRGLNIDSNKDLICRFETLRPDDISVAIGISEFKSVSDFYIMEDNTLSTFDKNEFDLLRSFGHKLKEVRQVPCENINWVLDKYWKNDKIDFLSLDCEGLDFQVLKSLNFDEFRPSIICVESVEYSITGSGKKRMDLIDFVKSQEYFEYAHTGLNSIMVSTQFWNE